MEVPNPPRPLSWTDMLLLNTPENVWNWCQNFQTSAVIIQKFKNIHKVHRIWKLA